MSKNISLNKYLNKISLSLNKQNEEDLVKLYKLIKVAMKKNKNIFLCGNGGSAANSIHIANDFLYLKQKIKSNLKYNIESLSSNTAILTCIGTPCWQ